MRSLLRLVLVLLCVQRGAGRWMRSLLSDQKQEAASSPMDDSRGGYPPEEGRQAEASGSKAPPGPLAALPARARRSPPDPQCGLRSVLLQVRDLGLGYDSDESVLFKYCGGACARVRSNHDLTLSNLLLGGLLPQPAPGEQRHDAPCCRPTHHEDMAFLDNSHRWHKVEKLSAAGCSCVG